MLDTLDLEHYSGALDLPDERDYTHAEVFGEMAASIELPRKVMLNASINLMQGNTGACTIVAGINVRNESNKQALSDAIDFIAWQRIWEIAKTKGASDTRGWYLQSAQQLLKDEGITGGYVRVGDNGSPNILALKTILAIEKKAIYTGVTMANWSETTRTHEYSLVRPSVVGHAFDIVGYDDDYKCADGTFGAFFVENSWENGHFYFPYSQVKHLFTQYVNIYSDEVAKMIEARKKRRTVNLQKAYEAKIWNETEPARAVTGYETRVMVNTALKLPKEFLWTRKAVQMLAQDKISRGKVLIAQTGRDWEITTDLEFNLIMQRHITRNPTLNVEILTREQMAEVIGRDFL